MKAFAEFTIPIKGLKLGLYQYDFQIGNDFFQEFENSYIEKGDINIKLNLEKRSRSYTLDFEISGLVEVECDRCIELFNQSISGENSIILNLDKDAAVSDDEDIEYIGDEIYEYNVAQHIYEFVLLSVPMFKAHPDDSCSLDYDKITEESNSEEQENTITEDNPFWEALQQYNSDKK